MTPMRRRTSPGDVATSSPARRARPDVGCSSVQRILMVVVLPAPFGPRNPKISPAPTEKPMPRTASTSPYFLARSSTSMAAASCGRVASGAGGSAATPPWRCGRSAPGRAPRRRSCVARRQRAGGIGRGRVADAARTPGSGSRRSRACRSSQVRHGSGIQASPRNAPKRGRVAPDRRQRPRRGRSRR